MKSIERSSQDSERLLRWPPADGILDLDDPWRRYIMALDNVTDRLQRITAALEEAAVPYAMAGGQAVAFWVATKDPAAVRTTKDVDILVRRQDLPAARAAALAAGMDSKTLSRPGRPLGHGDLHFLPRPVAEEGDLQ
ncbi:MAG: nucleotidyltransferase family protein [Thermoguttaceae bacterium]